MKLEHDGVYDGQEHGPWNRRGVYPIGSARRHVLLVGTPLTEIQELQP